MASIRFDFPAPFGPIRTFSACSSSWWESGPNDRRFRSLIVFRNRLSPSISLHSTRTRQGAHLNPHESLAWPVLIPAHQRIHKRPLDRPLAHNFTILAPEVSRHQHLRHVAGVWLLVPFGEKFPQR